jgi:positive regulator of sigma E activity
MPTANQKFSFISLSVAYFFHIYNNETIAVETNENFWFAVGILFYFSGSFFTFLTYMTFKTYVFQNIANSIKNLIFATGLWARVKSLKASTF